jgi:hypothetical protein
LKAGYQPRDRDRYRGIAAGMNAAELYFLGWRLTAIASESLPGESVLRRLSPAARLVLEDAAAHPGAAASEIARPRRVTRDEIRAVFGAGWRVDAIEPDGPAVGPRNVTSRT